MLMARMSGSIPVTGLLGPGSSVVERVKNSSGNTSPIYLFDSLPWDRRAWVIRGSSVGRAPATVGRSLVQVQPLGPFTH